MEFFVPAKDWEALRGRLVDTSLREKICFYAANAKGDFASSDLVQPGHGAAAEVPPPATNAVTWGVFPSKEIITPTIIEEVSFRAWSEEAFGIWAEWARVYRPEIAVMVTTAGCPGSRW